MRQWYPALRHANEFQRVMGVQGDPQSTGIRESDVFRCGDDKTPRDETRVFAGMQHFRQPIQRGIRIGAADGFDESRNRIVMRIAIGIIDHRLALDRFLGDFECQVNHAVVTQRCG